MAQTAPVVLIIEDDEGIRRFLRAAFATEGYRVIESITGRRGTLDAGIQKPDLAIVDLGLPDMGRSVGLETLGPDRGCPGVQLAGSPCRGTIAQLHNCTLPDAAHLPRLAGSDWMVITEEETECLCPVN